MYLGTLLLAMMPLDNNGNAVATTAAFGLGTAITGVYSGDSQYQSTQRDLALTVYSGQVIITLEMLGCSHILISTATQPAAKCISRGVRPVP
jgi:hypothetical protein